MFRTPYYLFISIALILIGTPFLIASFSADSNSVFGGFLFNPIDGNSYLAKMRLGFEGEWKFHLPYTTEQGNGAYIFLYYLFLGHVARLTGGSLQLIFHLARLFGSLFLLIALAGFVEKIFAEKIASVRILSFVLVVFGSGFGWIAAILGGFTSDFWVAEMYPFLSMYANPHFPLGLGIVIIFLTFELENNKKVNPLMLFGLGIVEAIVFQFGFVVAISVAIIFRILSYKKSTQFSLRNLIWFGLGGAPVLLYQYSAIITDPVLSQWNAQNQTPAPPVWDLLVALSPAFLCLLFYLFKSFKDITRNYPLLLAWVLGPMILAYLPFALQRRFLAGIFIPVALFGILGIIKIAGGKKKRVVLISSVMIIFSIISNVVVVAGGLSASKTPSNDLFYRREEISAIKWLDHDSNDSAVVLAAPRTSLIIPVYSKLNVVYGHPFETIEADQRLPEAENILSNKYSISQMNQYFSEHRIEYIFYGPTEQSFGDINPFSELSIIYDQDGIIIYSTDDS